VDNSGGKASRHARRAKALLAERELRRRRARSDLAEWVKLWVPNYRMGDFHAHLISKLMQFEQDVLAGRRPRLMLFVPPAHGKSEIVSRAYPSWFLGRNPQKLVISSSYNQSLSNEFGATVRNRIDSDEWRSTFRLGEPVTATTSTITLQQGGMYRALGVQGTGGGKHADLFVIDDPVKNRLDAESPTYRQRVWDFYSGTVRNRLKPGAGVLLVMTRYHVDDLAGRLLKLAASDPQADQWEVIEFPAIATRFDELGRMPGDPLCPELYDLPELVAVEHSTLPRDWASLFQQQPYLEGGNLIKVNCINRMPRSQMPTFETVYQSWDVACTNTKEKGYGDSSACITWGRTADGQLWIIDVHQMGVEAPAVADEIIRLYRKWRPAQVWGEAGGIGAAIRSVLDERLRLLGMNLPIRWIVVNNRGNKVARSLPLRDAIGLGMVTIIDDAPWTQGFLDECRMFPDTPGSPNQVDAATLGLWQIRRIAVGGEATPAQDTRPSPAHPTAAVLAKELAGRRALTQYAATRW